MPQLVGKSIYCLPKAKKKTIKSRKMDKECVTLKDSITEYEKNCKRV
jgi:hypothetical protein